MMLMRQYGVLYVLSHDIPFLEVCDMAVSNNSKKIDENPYFTLFLMHAWAETSTLILIKFYQSLPINVVLQT